MSSFNIHLSHYHYLRYMIDIVSPIGADFPQPSRGPSPQLVGRPRRVRRRLREDRGGRVGDAVGFRQEDRQVNWGLFIFVSYLVYPTFLLNRHAAADLEDIYEKEEVRRHSNEIDKKRIAYISWIILHPL